MTRILSSVRRDLSAIASALNVFMCYFENGHVSFSCRSEGGVLGGGGGGVKPHDMSSLR